MQKLLWKKSNRLRGYMGNGKPISVAKNRVVMIQNASNMKLFFAILWPLMYHEWILFLDFCVFVESTKSKNYDVIIDIIVHFRSYTFICFIRNKMLYCQITVQTFSLCQITSTKNRKFMMIGFCFFVVDFKIKRFWI